MVLVAAVLALALLVARRSSWRWRTRRLLNVGLLGATVLVVALGAWALVAIVQRPAARRWSAPSATGSDLLHRPVDDAASWPCGR